jgi:hypothetical protein
MCSTFRTLYNLALHCLYTHVLVMLLCHYQMYSPSNKKIVTATYHTYIILGIYKKDTNTGAACRRAYAS